jgi:hypothetical protein
MTPRTRSRVADMPPDYSRLINHAASMRGRGTASL